MTRVKTYAPASKTKFHAVCNDYAALSIQLTKLLVKRDMAIQCINDNVQPDIDKIKKDMDGLFAQAKGYADENRSELFDGPEKTACSGSADYGYRLSNPTLKLLNRKWTWDEVIEALKANGLTDYIRTKEEPNKDAMKLQLTDAQLATVGTRIDQKDEFWIDPHSKVATCD